MGGKNKLITFSLMKDKMGIDVQKYKLHLPER